MLKNIIIMFLGVSTLVLCGFCIKQHRDILSLRVITTSEAIADVCVIDDCQAEDKTTVQEKLESERLFRSEDRRLYERKNIYT